MVSRHRRRDGSGLYGAVAVKRPSVSRGRNHVVDRLPPTPQGRVRRLSVACRPTPSFRGSAADYPAKRGIPLAGGPGGDCGGPACRPWSTAPGLPLCRAHRGSADAGSGHAELLLSIVTVTFPAMIRGEPASGRGTSRRHSCIRGSGRDRTMMQPCASTWAFSPRA